MFIALLVVIAAAFFLWHIRHTTKVQSLTTELKALETKVVALEKSALATVKADVSKVETVATALAK